MKELGAFCKIYGNTIDNHILQYLLENQDIDFAVGDMANELGISRPKAYQVVANFEKKNYVIRSRVIGKTQLFILNKENKIVQLFLKDFMECLRLVVDDYSNQSQKYTIKPRNMVIADKGKKK